MIQFKGMMNDNDKQKRTHNECTEVRHNLEKEELWHSIRLRALAMQ